MHGEKGASLLIFDGLNGFAHFQREKLGLPFELFT